MRGKVRIGRKKKKFHTESSRGEQSGTVALASLTPNSRDRHLVTGIEFSTKSQSKGLEAVDLRAYLEPNFCIHKGSRSLEN